VEKHPSPDRKTPPKRSSQRNPPNPESPRLKSQYPQPTEPSRALVLPLSASVPWFPGPLVPRSVGPQSPKTVNDKL
jgi:hypothetical protein